MSGRTSLRRRWLVAVGAIVCATGLAGSAGLGSAAPHPSRAVRIGARPTIPARATALGPLGASTALRVEIALQPRDPAALAQFVAAVSTPGSPRYRHYLPAGAFADTFGPSGSTIASVEQVLRADGLHVGKISANHLTIPVTGTVARIGSAFSLSFERYRVEGRDAFANTSAPRLPAAVAPDIQGVVGLDDLSLLHPELVHSSPQARAHGLRAAARPAVTGPQPCAAATTAATSNGAYTADQLASAYDFSGLYGGGDEGDGITVALFELEPNLASDITAYQTCYGTSASVIYVTVDGAPARAPAWAKQHSTSRT